MSRLRELWNTDRALVIGIGLATVSFALIALPANVAAECAYAPEPPPCFGSEDWFSGERLPAALGFGFASVVVLLIRGRR